MSKYARLNQLIKGFQKENVIFFTAKIAGIENNTCTIDLDGLLIDQVRLKPTTTESENSLLLIPAIGSYALIGSFSGDYNNLFVLAADEYEKLEISCNGVNLMDTVSSLIDALSGTLQLTTPQGAATGKFDPATIANLKNIKSQFKQILK